MNTKLPILFLLLSSCASAPNTNLQFSKQEAIANRELIKELAAKDMEIYYEKIKKEAQAEAIATATKQPTSIIIVPTKVQPLQQPFRGPLYAPNQNTSTAIELRGNQL